VIAAVPATTPISQRGIRPVVPVLDMILKKTFNNKQKYKTKSLVKILYFLCVIYDEQKI
jgi:hypothetical protein